ncbi:MAG: DUF4168 domain-containing protein [Betaproteobacteria bacterium]
MSVIDHDGGREPSESSFSDDDLKSFVLAAIKVQRISESCAARLDTARSPDEQREIKESAAGEMVEAVENEGISVDQYQRIAIHAQSDEKIAERLKQQIANVH